MNTTSMLILILNLHRMILNFSIVKYSLLIIKNNSDEQLNLTINTKIEYAN